MCNVRARSAPLRSRFSAFETGREFAPAGPAPIQAGVTLLEMLVVISIIAVISGISYPSIANGLDSLKIGAAADGVASFLDSAGAKADRKQAVVEVTILRRENAMFLRSTDPTLGKRFDMPEGIHIERVFPEIEGVPPDAPRHFLLYPGGSAPAMGVEIVNQRGTRRLIRISPITGVPVIDKPQ